MEDPGTVNASANGRGYAFVEQRRLTLLRILQGLSPFLTGRPGVNSGLMISQYTAAALCAENLRRILAIEWVAAARGIELRAPLQPAAGTAAALNLLRNAVTGPGPDRWLSPELAAADQMLIDEALVPALESATGPLT